MSLNYFSKEWHKFGISILKWILQMWNPLFSMTYRLNCLQVYPVYLQCGNCSSQSVIKSLIAVIYSNTTKWDFLCLIIVGTLCLTVEPGFVHKGGYTVARLFRSTVMVWFIFFVPRLTCVYSGRGAVFSDVGVLPLITGYFVWWTKACVLPQTRVSQYCLREIASFHQIHHEICGNVFSNCNINVASRAH